MAKKNQPERWESLILAFALAVAGTLFVFDKLSSFASIVSAPAIQHIAPVFLAVIGLSLMLADQSCERSSQRSPRGERHE
jgi:predicted tellurium resistance membrane protein TerC